MSEKRLLVTQKFEFTYWWERFESYYAPHFDRIEVDLISNEDVDGQYWRQHHQRVTGKLGSWLKEYDLVMFADCDEFVVPNPERYKDLSDYLDGWKYDIAHTFGQGVMEMPDDDPFDHSLLVTQQRKYWYRDRNYDKPIITRTPVKYRYGFHKCDTRVSHPDHDLILFHLRDADFINLDKYCPQRNPRNFRNIPNIMSYEQRLAICKPIPEKYIGLI